MFLTVKTFSIIGILFFDILDAKKYLIEVGGSNEMPDVFNDTSDDVSNDYRFGFNCLIEV